jgi:hypothetical protein
MRHQRLARFVYLPHGSASLLGGGGGAGGGAASGKAKGSSGAA